MSCKLVVDDPIGTCGYTLSVNNNSPYNDLRKVCVLLLHLSERNNIIEAQRSVDKEYIEILQRKEIGDGSKYTQLFSKYWDCLQKVED